MRYFIKITLTIIIIVLIGPNYVVGQAIEKKKSVECAKAKATMDEKRSRIKISDYLNNSNAYHVSSRLETPFIALHSNLPESEKKLRNKDDITESSGEDEIKREDLWDFSLRLGLNASQAYYRAWAQGGTEHLSAIGNTVFTATYEKNMIKYSSRVELRYGQTRQANEDFRKSDDIIRIRNRFLRKLSNEQWSFTGNVNFETQFDKGYDRNFENVKSRFMSPGILTETAGLFYEPNDRFNVTLGLSLRQTFFSDRSLSEEYGLEEGDWFRNEAGLSSLIHYSRKIWSNVTYTGYIETFSNAGFSKFMKTDVFVNNEIEGRINDYLTTHFDFSLQYNKDITSRLQIRQILSVGFSYFFLQDKK